MIAIVVLQNGQQLVTDLREVREPNEDGTTNPDGDLICFMFVAPLVLGFSEYIEEKKQYRVTFDRWVPFSKETQFRVPVDKVVAVGEPTDSIRQTYIEKIYPENKLKEIEE